MNAKHTPGPWEVHKQKDAGIGNRGSHFEILHPLINQEGEYKGQLGGYHIIIGEIDTPKVSEADARLIAAAPELLESAMAAEEVLGESLQLLADMSLGLHVEQKRALMERLDKMQKAWPALCKAIAKAEAK